MATKLIIPKFKNESEEADWLYENREMLSAEFEQAGAEGRLGRGTALKRAMENAILLDVEDMTKAHAVAARKGVSYQAYVKTLVHEALEKESAA
jgi:hypothetical protein